MNYYNCDHITWKASLSLMKSDPNAQRVYSNIYQMTRDVLMTALTISAVASLILLTIGLIKIGIEHLTDTPIMDSISVIILFSTLCPAIFAVRLAWVLSYFGFYKNMKKINSLMNYFIASFPDAERVEPINPVSYTIYYGGHEFIVLFQEHPTASLRVGKGKVILLMPYLDTKEGRTIEILSEEIIKYLEGKNCAPSGMSDNRQTDNITFDQLKDKLSSIFGYKNFVNGINCIEYNNRIIIAPAGSKVPVITIYKFKNNSTDLGTGITLNPSQTIGEGTGMTGWNTNLEEQLTKVIDGLLDVATYSMSFDIAGAANKTDFNNEYVTLNADQTITMTFAGQTFTYDNYMQYIVDNKLGKIKLDTMTVAGVPTNFDPTPKNSAAKQKLRVEYEVLRPVEDATDNRAKTISDIEAAGNRDNVSINELIRAVAPQFTSASDKAILDEILPKEVSIDVESDRTEFAVYNRNTDKITLFKPFFALARNSEYKAVRTFVHEQLHRRIYSTGIMESQKFINEMTAIRDEFINALNNPELHPMFDKYIKDKGYDRNTYIENLRQVVDPATFEGKDFNYMLEEFIVESLTNNVLNDALNNIESTKSITAETKRPSLWQKVINLIRELFGFNKIQDNTLLAQEFKTFGQKFKDIKVVEQKIEQQTVDTNIKEDVPISNVTIDTSDAATVSELFNDAGNNNEVIEDADDLFSAIDISNDGISVPNMNAVRAGLNTSERTRFDASLTTGETKIYCR